MWLGFVLLFWFLELVAFARRGAFSEAMFESVPLFMLGGFALVVVLVRAIGLGDHARLYDLITSTLDARPFAN